MEQTRMIQDCTADRTSAICSAWASSLTYKGMSRATSLLRLQFDILDLASLEFG